jgi:hypothetical protein
MLAHQHPVVLDELVDGLIIGSCGDRRQLDVGLEHRVGEEVLAGDVQRGPGFA